MLPDITIDYIGLQMRRCALTDAAVLSALYRPATPVRDVGLLLVVDELSPTSGKVIMAKSVVQVTDLIFRFVKANVRPCLQSSYDRRLIQRADTIVIHTFRRFGLVVEIRPAKVGDWDDVVNATLDRRGSDS